MAIGQGYYSFLTIGPDLIYFKKACLYVTLIDL